MVLPPKTPACDQDPLLLLPGLLCDARLWRDQVADLSASPTRSSPI